ncbi:MAG TPA: hypothetical protein VFE47_02425 [Tepidisphaeraceae bacterium]|nr:hypothetical protein [Tepidisphaeraceae bacterium]
MPTTVDAPILIPSVLQVGQTGAYEDWSKTKARTRSRCRSLGAKAFRRGSMGLALKDAEFVDVDEIQGRLVINSRPIDIFPGDFLFGCTIDGIKSGTRRPSRDEDREIEHARRRDCILTSLEDGWFCLELLAYRNAPLFPTTYLESGVYRAIVRSISSIWPKLVRINSHLAGHSCGFEVEDWTRWGLNIAHFCSQAGIYDDRLRGFYKLDIHAAGDQLAKWVAEFGDR